MNRFGSNLNRRHKIKCLKFKISEMAAKMAAKMAAQNFKATTKPFTNRFYSNLNCMHRINR